MSNEILNGLTRYNSHLSRPTTGQMTNLLNAINFTHEVPDSVLQLLNDSLAQNTRKAYLSDLAEFERFGGSIPASAETVAAYLAARADTLAVATLVRHIAALCKRLVVERGDVRSDFTSVQPGNARHLFLRGRNTHVTIMVFQ